MKGLLEVELIVFRYECEKCIPARKKIISCCNLISKFPQISLDANHTIAISIFALATMTTVQQNEWIGERSQLR